MWPPCLSARRRLKRSWLGRMPALPRGQLGSPARGCGSRRGPGHGCSRPMAGLRATRRPRPARSHRWASTRSPWSLPAALRCCAVAGVPRPARPWHVGARLRTRRARRRVQAFPAPGRSGLASSTRLSSLASGGSAATDAGWRLTPGARPSCPPACAWPGASPSTASARLPTGALAWSAPWGGGGGMGAPLASRCRPSLVPAMRWWPRPPGLGVPRWGLGRRLRALALALPRSLAPPDSPSWLCWQGQPGPRPGGRGHRGARGLRARLPCAASACARLKVLTGCPVLAIPLAALSAVLMACRTILRSLASGPRPRTACLPLGRPLRVPLIATGPRAERTGHGPPAGLGALAVPRLPPGVSGLAVLLPRPSGWPRPSRC